MNCLSCVFVSIHRNSALPKAVGVGVYIKPPDGTMETSMNERVRCCCKGCCCKGCMLLQKSPMVMKTTEQNSACNDKGAVCVHPYTLRVRVVPLPHCIKWGRRKEKGRNLSYLKEQRLCRQDQPDLHTNVGLASTVP